MGGLENVEVGALGSRVMVMKPAYLDVFLIQRVELVEASRVKNFELKGDGSVRVDVFFFFWRKGTHGIGRPIDLACALVDL